MCGFVHLLWLYFRYLVLSVEKCLDFSFYCQCCPFLLMSSKKQSIHLIFKNFELILRRFMHKCVAWFRILCFVNEMHTYIF